MGHVYYGRKTEMVCSSRWMFPEFTEISVAVDGRAVHGEWHHYHDNDINIDRNKDIQTKTQWYYQLCSFAHSTCNVTITMTICVLTTLTLTLALITRYSGNTDNTNISRHHRQRAGHERPVLLPARVRPESESALLPETNYPGEILIVNAIIHPARLSELFCI